MYLECIWYKGMGFCYRLNFIEWVRVLFERWFLLIWKILILLGNVGWKLLIGNGLFSVLNSEKIVELIFNCFVGWIFFFKGY